MKIKSTLILVFVCFLGIGSMQARTVNVVDDYGADPTGSTDSSSAIQNALNAGKCVFFPSGTYLANNLLLPSVGIKIDGENPKSTIIKNTHSSNPTFYTSSSISRNMGIFIKGLSFLMATDEQSGDAIRLYNPEFALIENCYITTPPTYATTGNGIYAERTASGSSGYYITIKKTFIDKQKRGIYLKGGSGYRMNVHLIEDCVINNNTEVGVLFEECTAARLKDSSLELNADNVKIVDSSGCMVLNCYMERPDTHNVVLDNAEACRIAGNVLSSGGNVNQSTGRAVVVKADSVFCRLNDNYICGGWSSYDVEIQSQAKQTLIKDNVTKDRVNGWPNYGTSIQDNGTQTTYSNPYLSAGGSMFWDFNAQNIILTGLSFASGEPVKIGGTQSGIYGGTGNPVGNVTANRGSLYLRTDGGSGYTFYIKESGDNTNTGWVAK